MAVRKSLSLVVFLHGGAAAVIAIVLIFFPVGVSASGSAKVEERKDPLVAKVGDIGIRESELIAALDNYVPPGAYHVGMDPSKKEKYRKDALSGLIEFQLLYNEAVKKEMKVPEDRIDAIVAANVKRHGSMEKLAEALKRDGSTMASFREKIRKFQMVRAVLEDIAAESLHSEEALREYYEKNKGRYKRPESMHLYEILISVDPAADKDEAMKKKEKAEEVLRKIRAGEDFGQTAYKYSEDEYRFKSGDIGFVHRGELALQEVEDVAFSLKQGEVSEVVRTIRGFTILMAGEKRPEETMSFDKVKNKMKRDLDVAKFNEKKKEMLSRLKSEYPVVVYLKFEDEGGPKEDGAAEEGGKTK